MIGRSSAAVDPGATLGRMRRRVTLTFDNGPTRVTAQVLDLLAQRGLLATFFLVGERLRRPGARELAERALREGHHIGNHSLTHATPLGVNDDPAEAEREIDGMQALLGDLVPGERFFRPFGGGGHIDRNLLGRHAVDHLMRGRYTCVLWSSVPRDWENPEGWPDVCLADLDARPWSVVVLHDLPTGAMARLPAFLDALDARGIEVVHEFPEDCVPIRFGRPTPSFGAIPLSEQ
jgi:peptidoglycan/xylan/chitin deacetylase (PgdA/CDA1 family)